MDARVFERACSRSRSRWRLSWTWLGIDRGDAFDARVRRLRPSTSANRTRAATTDAHQMRTVVVGHRRGRRRGGGSSERAVATGRAPAGNWLPNIGDLSGSHGTGRDSGRVNLGWTVAPGIELGSGGAPFPEAH